jgi:hypothetical protein
MARINWVVRHGATLANTLSGVRSLSITKGRKYIQDPFRYGSAIINGTDVASLPAIAVGDRIQIRTTPSSLPTYDGIVSNFVIDYGFVPNQDKWTITCEDSLAIAGRTIFNGSFTAGNNTWTAISLLLSSIGGFLIGGSGTGTQTVSAQTFTNENLLEVLNRTIATEQGRLGSGAVTASLAQIQVLSRTDFTTPSVLLRFTDTPYGGAYAYYDSVEFSALADRYATKVVVNPEGLASQTAGSGNRTFSIDSYDQTTAKALSLATYVVGKLNLTSAYPTLVSAVLEASPSNDLLIPLIYDGGVSVEVALRGVVYDCTTEGWTLTADPQKTRITYYLSDR